MIHKEHIGNRKLKEIIMSTMDEKKHFTPHKSHILKCPKIPWQGGVGLLYFHFWKKKLLTSSYNENKDSEVWGGVGK